MVSETGKVGRPRSEQARTAILNAVDDLLVDVGYGAMTLKGIAERAGVSRQTIYRWWSTKAEILVEASTIDARQELDVTPRGSPVADVTAYLDALRTFLTTSDAGAAYRALLGEAQHDSAVRKLLQGSDPVGESAEVVITRALSTDSSVSRSRAVSSLVGPIFFWILSGRDPDALDTHALAREFLRSVAPTPAQD